GARLLNQRPSSGATTAPRSARCTPLLPRNTSPHSAAPQPTRLRPKLCRSGPADAPLNCRSPRRAPHRRSAPVCTPLRSSPPARPRVLGENWCLRSLSPNFVTALRIILTPFIADGILHGRPLAAFWLAIAAGFTDVIDGYLARHFGSATET